MLPAIIVGLIALMGISMGVDIAFDRVEASKIAKIQTDIDHLRRFEAALTEAEDGVRGYLMSGRSRSLELYVAAIAALSAHGPSVLPTLDQQAFAQPDAGGSETRVSTGVAALRTAWQTAIGLAGDNQRTAAEAILASIHTDELMDLVRSNATLRLERRETEAAERTHWSDSEQTALQAAIVGLAICAIVAMIYAFRSIIRAVTSGFSAKEQIEQLFAMADMLQSAAGQEDTNEVLRTTALSLLPGLSGTLYVFNNSRDRLDLSTKWGSLVEASADHITPTSCWALKRGKPHLNRLEDGALRCSHSNPGKVILEIPMAARGQLYGLLEIIAEGADAAMRLDDIRPIANAVGDAMSLALSSIALRERLRNQALRDSLTGLYNRRFLEEMLERMSLDAERRKTSISAIMIDLDHFKKLNDQHGHAAGDAVLRDVAAAILSCLRSVDIACRYGGEEMAVLLSDCSITAATGKAEQIRSRIAELTSAGGAAVTASFGVASIPETSREASDLLSAADAALYEAKQQGRNRVVSAAIRPSAKRLSLIETPIVSDPA
jgi:diguanylate cyclase (GGDEF)-like protein